MNVGLCKITKKKSEKDERRPPTIRVYGGGDGSGDDGGGGGHGITMTSKTQHQQREQFDRLNGRVAKREKKLKLYESWSTNLKGYKYKWNIKLKWISVI